jgi:hypothetical protein
VTEYYVCKYADGGLTLLEPLSKKQWFDTSKNPAISLFPNVSAKNDYLVKARGNNLF